MFWACFANSLSPVGKGVSEVSEPRKELPLVSSEQEAAFLDMQSEIDRLKRDLDLAVLEARWNEHVTSCSACIRIESGHTHWRCDRRADLQKQKADLPKT
jgi:hypothetical protein